LFQVYVLQVRDLADDMPKNNLGNFHRKLHHPYYTLFCYEWMKQLSEKVAQCDRYVVKLEGENPLRALVRRT
jgi:hypothetical protein